MEIVSWTCINISLPVQFGSLARFECKRAIPVLFCAQFKPRYEAAATATADLQQAFELNSFVWRRNKDDVGLTTTTT